MKKTKKMDKSKILHISLIFVLMLLIFIYSFRAYQHYGILKSHRSYFKQPNQDIQPWMTIRSVERHFNISQSEVFQELKINATATNQRLTIESICKKYKLNCTEVIIGLNSLKST